MTDKFFNPETKPGPVVEHSTTPEGKSLMKKIEYADLKYGEDSPEAFESVKKDIRKIAHKNRYVSLDEDVEETLALLAPESHDRQMDELAYIFEQKGLSQALKALYKLHNYHLEDDFHRFIVQYLKREKQSREIKGKKAATKLLNKTLYEVSLPEVSDDTKKLSEVISRMEQFYAGIMSIPDKKDKGKTAVSFEIALPHVGEEVSFYVAIPDNKKTLFEKQLLSIFPSAKVREEKDDYNIFNDKGYSLATTASFVKNEAFSLRTYEEFDYDPLNVILNAFSKLEKAGEGAAIQIVFNPRDDFYLNRYGKAIEKIKSGKPVKEALDFNESFTRGFGKFAKELVVGKPKKKEDDQSEGPDLDVIENIKHKISSPVVGVNLRLVVSASDKDRANSIMDELKSSFNQFEKTTGNSLKWGKMTGRGMISLLRKFTFRDFDKAEVLPMSLKEITSIFHFAESTLKSSSNLRQSKANTSPAPVGLRDEGVLLGINEHRSEEKKIFFAPEDRMRHFYVIGQTGTGKTTILKNMIIQDIQNGEGICMIDPHGSDIEDILANIPPERQDDVIYFDPANLEHPMGLNMLEYDPMHPEQKTFVVNEMLSIFDKLFNMQVAGGPAFEQYFRNSALLAMEDPESGSTLLEISRVLSDPEFRKMKLSKTSNPVIHQFWNNAEQTTGDAALANFVPYITNKFDNFLNNEYMRPIISQQHSSLNFRKIMDERKILLVNLSKGRLGDLNSNLLGLLIVGKILMAALSRVDSLGTDLPPFYLYIDEFQNVTTPSISTILSEARKYKLSLNIAHQFIAQLDEKIRESVFGNVGSIAAFRVGAKDAEYLESQFEPVFNAHDLLNVDNYNAFLRLLSEGRPVRPFSLKTLPPPQGNKEAVSVLKKLSAQRYGRPRAEIEAEIARKYGLA